MPRLTIHLTALALALGCLLALPPAANAVLIWDLDCSLPEIPCSGEDNSTGSTAVLTFAFSASGTDIKIAITAENTSPAPGPGGNLTAFAFELPAGILTFGIEMSSLMIPDGSGTDFTTLLFDYEDINLNPFGAFDACLTSGSGSGSGSGNNCQGGSGAGGGGVDLGHSIQVISS